jgi:hypothetical protein
VLYACWSVKGGSGTTVVAATLALSLAARGDPVLLADLAGDLPAALGVPEPDGPGLVDWLAAGDDLPADALSRLEVEVNDRLGLVGRGSGPWSTGRPETLAAALVVPDRLVVADCGTLPPVGAPEVPLAVAAMATRSVLVVRPCYLALRRAQAAPVRASQVVVVDEPGRALDARDVEAVLGLPLLAEIITDPSVARAVDAGLLATRVPRSLSKVLDRVLVAER